MYSFHMTMPEFDEKGRVFVELPFNVWEVFNKKGAMRVDVSLNQMKYECSLIPRGKGIYLLPIKKPIIKKLKITAGDMLNITMELMVDSKKEDNVKETPKNRRKISEIQLVREPSNTTCGQACVAMIAGVSVEDAIKVMRTKGPTSIGQIIEALDHYHIDHAERNKRISKKNPTPSDIAILTVHMPEYRHWVVYYKGKYYDPEFGVLESCHPDGKTTSFLEIYSS